MIQRKPALTDEMGATAPIRVVPPSLRSLAGIGRLFLYPGGGTASDTFTVLRRDIKEKYNIKENDYGR